MLNTGILTQGAAARGDPSPITRTCTQPELLLSGPAGPQGVTAMYHHGQAAVDAAIIKRAQQRQYVYYK